MPKKKTTIRQESGKTPMNPAGEPVTRVCFNKASQLIREGKGISETLQQLVYILPAAWNWPEHAFARIRFAEEVFTSPGFARSQWAQSQLFETADGRTGSIEIFYDRELPKADVGPFRLDERHLLVDLARIITDFIDRQSVSLSREDQAGKQETNVSGETSGGRSLLKEFLRKQNDNRDVFHDLMPYKVKEILLIATLYDAHIIEKEGRFFENILGEYAALNLTSLPRITGVSNNEDALQELRNKHYDLVIMMMGVDKKVVLRMSRQIKAEFAYTPIFVLLSNSRDIEFFTNGGDTKAPVDRVFVWSGDTRIFFAMVKLLEDSVNLANDTKIGLVRSILLVEDSAKYYSRYLPVLYNIVLEQTKRIIADVSTDDLYKVLRMRARPKILLASTYEEAVSIINEYPENLLALISDVRFQKDGSTDANAGVQLVTYAREKIPGLPVIIQSSELSNKDRAEELNATFINKNSDSLNQEIRQFIMHFLGFGHFIFRDKSGQEIAVANTLREFEAQLWQVPDESILFHARQDHFSLWLMARGEIEVASILSPKKTSDFPNAAEMRGYLLQILHRHRAEQTNGKVIPFDENSLDDYSNIISLASGSLGGKGRGIAFINSLIYNFDFDRLLPGINIKLPWTAIIGTDAFEEFLQINDLVSRIYDEKDSARIEGWFTEASLPEELRSRLAGVIEVHSSPIAVRSSGLFEDSLNQPFAGIFNTYILPNNDPDPAIRLDQLCDAVKLVYASVFSNIARSYIEAIHFKIEEELMAVVIQELVGQRFEDVFYPHISGVAQSYNYYPFAHMKPEEGFAVLAVGLGKYVVEGEKAYRFSPKYPGSEINSPKDQYKNSQVSFYSVNLSNTNPDLLTGEMAGLIRLDIDDAERHGTIKHSASVLDMQSKQIIPGLTHAGPRIINFANILKFNYIPLADTLQTVLEVVKEAMGSPVEIEFAIDLSKDDENRTSFYLLQIKPLIGSNEDFTIKRDEIDEKHLLIFTPQGMGNGLIEHVRDVVYIPQKGFDKSKTLQMATEIEQINRKLKEENRQYVLIGPGRWGTRDPWIGIPVTWPQISGAKVIIETDLEDYPLDASSGSHFFHNVTSMNVGYFSVYHKKHGYIMNLDILDEQELVNSTRFVRHVRFERPLRIMMDGKKRSAAIIWNPVTDDQ